MLVGEQPGDQEDIQGRPFVGPAGKILDKALEAVGIDRKEVYVTNAVKHFKWEPRGKSRIHKKPNSEPETRMYRAKPSTTEHWAAVRTDRDLAFELVLRRAGRDGGKSASDAAGLCRTRSRLGRLASDRS